MIRDIIEESSFAQLLIEEGREGGERAGLEAGWQEGQWATVRLAPESRFGPLDASVLAALGTADGTALQLLLAHLATDAKEQVRARLGLS